MVAPAAPDIFVVTYTEPGLGPVKFGHVDVQGRDHCSNVTEAQSKDGYELSDSMAAVGNISRVGRGQT